VREFEVQGCPANPLSTWSRLRIVGGFFNTSVPTPGSPINDVWAYIGLRRQSDYDDPSGVLRIVGSVFKLLDEDGRIAQGIGYKELGTVRVGRWVTIGIEWDEVGNRFIFYWGNKSTDIPYDPNKVPDENIAGAPTKGLEVTQRCPNCVEARTVASMDAFFDRVYVNQSAVPSGD
ncbi:MAG: hypothetical protein ACFFCW_38795, partial [Candidatus Hodarchaeota archaeon]